MNNNGSRRARTGNNGSRRARTNNNNSRKGRTDNNGLRRGRTDNGSRRGRTDNSSRRGRTDNSRSARVFVNYRGMGGTNVPRKKPTFGKNQKLFFPHNKVNFKQIRKVGTISSGTQVYLGMLKNVRKGKNRVIFEFQDGNVTFDAWSVGHMEANIALLKIGFCYTVKGYMLVQCVSKNKFDKATNASFNYKVLLGKIQVLKKETAPVDAIPTLPTKTSFRDLLGKLQSTQGLTEELKHVTIVKGEVYRYMGCEKCTTGITRADSDGKYYCRKCQKKDGPKKRKVCFVYRDIFLKDQYGEKIGEMVCFENDLKGLSLVGERLDDLRKDFCDSNSQNVFKKLIGQKIDATLRREKQNNFDQYPKSLVLTNIRLLSSTNAEANNETINDEEDHDLFFIDVTPSDPILNDAEPGPSNPTNATSPNRPAAEMPVHANLSRGLIYVQKNNDGYYPSPPKSLAFIINVKEAEGTTPRNGSEHDVTALKNTMKFLNVQLFENRVFNDLTKEELLTKMSKFKKELVDKNYSFCIFVLMTHGAGTLYKLRLKNRSDVVDINTDIAYTFADQDFPGFAGRPKLFIFQACQNQVAKYSQDEINRRGLPLNDMYVFLSCPPGVKAKRNPAKGSYFIQTIAKVFKENAHQLHLQEMLQKVSNEMSKIKLGENKEETNSPDLIYRNFSKKLCFKVTK